MKAPAIRIDETFGIRRFLYPLSTRVEKRFRKPAILGEEGEHLPSQIVDLETGGSRVDLAVSLPPFGRRLLRIWEGEIGNGLDDPLHFRAAQTSFQCRQKRFSTEYDCAGNLSSAIYDDIEHLRAPFSMLRNGKSMEVLRWQTSPESVTLTAWIEVKGKYPDQCAGLTWVEATACKSWVKVCHELGPVNPDDEVVLTLPLAPLSDLQSYDLGLGGGVYGLVREAAVLTCEFVEDGTGTWSVMNGKRLDFTGEIPALDLFRSQRWFHWIDGKKALVVAVTHLPAACRRWKSELCPDGNVRLGFLLSATEKARIEVCYHFLNDIPAVAAATSPQSILLAPSVTLEMT